MTIKTGALVTLRFSLAWSDGSLIDIRKQTGLSFVLTLPDDTTITITDLGYDELNNQVWVRISDTHTATAGTYKGNLSVFTTDLQMVTSGIVELFTASADGTETDAFINLFCTAVETPVNNGQGYSPKIVNSEWYVYDDSKKAYVATGQTIGVTQSQFENLSDELNEKVDEQKNEFASLGSSTLSDLSLTDEKKNAIAVFRNGEFAVKNFNSATTPSISENSDANLSIVDENENSIIDINGHIKTSRFNSRLLPMQNFKNPIRKEDFCDPTIWDGMDGYFYSCSSNAYSNLYIWRSADMVNWESTGEKMLSDEDVAIIQSTYSSYLGVWAPCVKRIGDKWNFYFSAGNASGIFVCQSSSPTGYFKFVKQLTTHNFGGSGENIDADVAVDKDGQTWMFFGSTGGMWRIKLTSDGLSLDEDSPSRVAGLKTAEYPSSDRAKIFEGAYLYRRKGYWYLFCSSGYFENNTYKLNVGRCETLGGIFVDKNGDKMVEGNATTILSSEEGDRFYGPGHNGAISVDENGHNYIAYHCHDTQVTTKATLNNNWLARPLFLQRIYWDAEGWPFFGNNGKPIQKETKGIIKGIQI